MYYNTWNKDTSQTVFLMFVKEFVKFKVTLTEVISTGIVYIAVNCVLQLIRKGNCFYVTYN